MIARLPHVGNWKEAAAHDDKNATHRSALFTKAEERRIFVFRRVNWNTNRPVLPVSDWLDQYYTWLVGLEISTGAFRNIVTIPEIMNANPISPQTAIPIVIFCPV